MPGSSVGVPDVPQAAALSIAFPQIDSTKRSDSRPDNGNLIAFLRAAQQCHGQLLWQAQRIANNREEAEDILQEALLKAFTRLHQFRGESKMSTWLRVIVRNTALEWLRKQRGRGLMPLDHLSNSDGEPLALDLPDPGRTPEQHFQNREMVDILLSKVNRLNNAGRCVIKLCALEELSQHEAADALGVTVFTVKSRVFQAKRVLRRAVDLHGLRA